MNLFLCVFVDWPLHAIVKCSIFFFLVGYSLWGEKKILGQVRALNLTVPVGSDDLGYGPDSGFSLKPVQTSNCWSAEPLKVALKVKMVSTAFHYIFLWMNQRFWMCGWMNGLKTQRQSLTATLWRNNETALTDSPCRTRRWNINRKSIWSNQIWGSVLTTNWYIYIYIYMYMLIIA